MATEDPDSVSDAKIIVGVDGSASSRSALVWAAHQAKLTGQPLEIVTAWHVPNDYGVGMTGFESIDFEGWAKEQLDSAIVDILPPDLGVTVTKQVVQGHPAPVLLTEAEDASMIVVGSNGHGEFTGMLLGSVSEYLATHSPCPVVIVRGTAAEK